MLFPLTVSCKTMINGVGKEIRRYETGIGNMVNRDKTVCLRLWNRASFPGSFLWMDEPVKILGVVSAPIYCWRWIDRKCGRRLPTSTTFSFPDSAYFHTRMSH